MAASNSETSVQHQESSELFIKRFLFLLQNIKDGLLDLKMAADILAVCEMQGIYDITNLLEEMGLIEIKSENLIQWLGAGPSFNTPEKTEKISELKKELIDLENTEMEIDQLISLAKQNFNMDGKNDKAQLWVETKELCKSFPDDAVYSILVRPEGFEFEGYRVKSKLVEFSAIKTNQLLLLKSRNEPLEVSLVNQYPETNEPNVQSISVDDSANLLIPSPSITDLSEDKSIENLNDASVVLLEYKDFSGPEALEGENDHSVNLLLPATSITDLSEVKSNKNLDESVVLLDYKDFSGPEALEDENDHSGNLLLPATSIIDLSEDKSNDKPNEDLAAQNVDFEEHEDYYGPEDLEDEDGDIGGRAELVEPSAKKTRLHLKSRNGPIEVSLVNLYPETNEPNIQSMSVDESANLLLPSTSKTDASEDKSNEKPNTDLDDLDIDLEEHEDYSDQEEQEDENEDIGGKAEDKDETMEKDDSDDNDKSKVISAQPTRQLPPRKAAQRHRFIQPRYHENVENKKTDIIKRTADSKENSGEEISTRCNKTLKTLTTRFVDLLKVAQSQDGHLDLKMANGILAVRQKRQIHDITNILEAVGLIETKSKDSIQWRGAGPSCNAAGSNPSCSAAQNHLSIQSRHHENVKDKVSTIDQQYNEVRSQDTENHPVNNRVNNRVNLQAKAPLEYRDQYTDDEYEESEVSNVTGSENHNITVNKKKFPRGRKIYGCPYECGFECTPGRRFDVKRHLNSYIMNGKVRRPSCPIRRKMEVMCRDGTWPKSIKEPVFLREYGSMN